MAEEEHGIEKDLIEWADLDEYNDEHPPESVLKAILPDDAQIFSYA